MSIGNDEYIVAGYTLQVAGLRNKKFNTRIL